MAVFKTDIIASILMKFWTLPVSKDKVNEVVYLGGGGG